MSLFKGGNSIEERRKPSGFKRDRKGSGSERTGQQVGGGEPEAAHQRPWEERALRTGR